MQKEQNGFAKKNLQHMRTSVGKVLLHRFYSTTLTYHGFVTPSITIPASHSEKVYINPTTMRKIALSIAHEQTKQQQKEHPDVTMEKIPYYPTLMQFFNQPNRKCYITPAVYNDYKDFYPEEAIPKKLYFIFSKLSGLTLQHTMEQIFNNLQWTPDQITPEVQNELMYLIEASYRFPDGLFFCTIVFCKWLYKF